MLRTATRYVLAAFFCVAGLMHFVRPDPYVRMVPDLLPAPELLVAVSGAAEVLGGVALLHPRTRTAAGWGLVALLVAVFPANVNMALDPEGAGQGLPEWGLWLRLPLQGVFIAAVAWSARLQLRR